MITAKFKSRFSILLIIFILVITAIGCNSQPISETDDLLENNDISSEDTDTSQVEETSSEQKPMVLTQFDGSEVVLDEVSKSISAHSYAIALILHDLKVPGITSIMSTNRPLPDDLKALPSIGSPQNPDFELIKSYETDLLLSSSTFKDRTETFLKEQGITSCYLDISSYSDTRKNIEMLGNAFGRTIEMEALLNDIDQREQAVLSQIDDHEGKTIAIIMGTGKSFLFNTEKSYVGEMAEMMGLKSIVKSSERDESAVDFSTEQLIQMDPDIILRFAHGSNWEEVNKSFESTFAENRAFANLKAVKNDNVYDLDEELFTANAGTRSIESFETLAKVIFGIQ